MAVGRFLIFPIQNIFSENHLPHRKVPERKNRGMDVGGYMRRGPEAGRPAERKNPLSGHVRLRAFTAHVWRLRALNMSRGQRWAPAEEKRV